MNNVAKAYTGSTYDIDINNIEQEEVIAIKHGITINTYFALWIFDKFKDDNKHNFCELCVARFVCCSYVKDEWVERYKPIFFINNIKLPSYTVKHIIEKFEWLRYSIVLASVSYTQIDELLIDPEINVIWYCSKLNKALYESQVNKAKKLGFAYKYFDIDKNIYYDTPLKVGLDEIPEFKKDIDVFFPFRSDKIEEDIKNFLIDEY